MRTLPKTGTRSAFPGSADSADKVASSRAGSDLNSALSAGQLPAGSSNRRRRRAQGWRRRWAPPAEHRDLAQARPRIAGAEIEFGKEIARGNRSAVAQLGGAERLPASAGRQPAGPGPRGPGTARAQAASCCAASSICQRSPATGPLRGAARCADLGQADRELEPRMPRPASRRAPACASANCATAAFLTTCTRKQQRRRQRRGLSVRSA